MTGQGEEAPVPVTVTATVEGSEPAGEARGNRPVSAAAISGKSSGKLVANPEVESSGKSYLPLPAENLPLTPDDDPGIELEEEIDEEAQGWRMERNSNGYYRWRWQLKDADGNPITYVNSSGNVGYKRGSKYVTKEEAKDRL